MSFTEQQRYEYDLTPNSIVIDAGAHMGNFARAIGRRYGCRVYGFEPVPQFWLKAVENQTDKTTIFPVGLGGTTRFTSFWIRGDSTGEFAESEETGMGVLVSVQALFRLLKSDEKIALLKLNIEGGEHEVLEAILKLGMQDFIDNIQVQWHVVHPEAVQRMASIRSVLAETHALSFSNGFTWENWKRI